MRILVSIPEKMKMSPRGEVKAFYLRLSNILRRYIEALRIMHRRTGERQWLIEVRERAFWGIDDATREKFEEGFQKLL